MLSKICKSGFHHKIAIKYETSSILFDGEIMNKISTLAITPKKGTRPMSVVLDIDIPFLEAFKIMSNIIRYSHTVPTLDYVRFKNITVADLYALCATTVKSYQSVPFTVDELCYYPKTCCFEAYIKIDKALSNNQYSIRNRWCSIFQQMFKTSKFNISILKISGEADD